MAHRTIGLMILIGMVPNIQASVGKDMVGGIAAGTAAMGALHVAKEHKKTTEQQAMAIAALTGLTVTALIQSSLKESNLSDVLAHIATGLVTFNLMKFLADEFAQGESDSHAQESSEKDPA